MVGRSCVVEVATALVGQRSGGTNAAGPASASSPSSTSSVLSAFFPLPPASPSGCARSNHSTSMPSMPRSASVVLKVSGTVPRFSPMMIA